MLSTIAIWANQRAYADYLLGRLQPQDLPLLPPQHRAAAARLLQGAWGSRAVPRQHQAPETTEISESHDLTVMAFCISGRLFPTGAAQPTMEHTQ